MNSTISGTVWVADEHGNSITVIDASKNLVLTRLTGVEGPTFLQVSPDGNTVWAVSRHESLALMIDAKTLELHGSVPTGKSPAHSILSPDSRTAYTTNGDGTRSWSSMLKQRKRCKPSRLANTRMACAHAGRQMDLCGQRQGNNVVFVSPDNKTVLAANQGTEENPGTTVSMLDTATLTVVETIETGDGAHGVRLQVWINVALHADKRSTKIIN